MSEHDPHPEPDAETLVREAAARGLGSRRCARQFAVTLWASFLGAIPMLLLWWLMLPSEYAFGFGWHELSWSFFLCWLAAAFPASMAIALSGPSGAKHEPRP